MSDLVKGLHYRVLYKFPRQREVKFSYTANNFSDLMRNLQMTEGVNRQTVEYLYVHQITTGGGVIEILAIDSTKGVNVTNIKATPKKFVVTGEYDDDDLLGWGGSDDVYILDKVTALLTAGKDTLKDTKPKIILKAVLPKPKKKIKGYHITAIAAVPFTEN